MNRFHVFILLIALASVLNIFVSGQNVTQLAGPQNNTDEEVCGAKGQKGEPGDGRKCLPGPVGRPGIPGLSGPRGPPGQPDIFRAGSSSCSVKCGSGQKAVQKMKCNDWMQGLVNCTYHDTEMVPCRAPFECPEDKIYGPWSAWSPCSESCLSSVKIFPYQRRTRTCYPRCTVGFIEDRPCIVTPCDMKCPDYYPLEFFKDPGNQLRMAISFHIELGKVPYGQLISQELELYEDGESVARVEWWINAEKVNDDDGDPRVSSILKEKRTIYNLHMNQTYLPKIRIKSKVYLTHSLRYDRESTIIQECIGQVLVAKYWTCVSGDQHILASQVCDGEDNCRDHSDESDELCRPSPLFIFICLGLLILYAVIGALCYFLVAAYSSNHPAHCKNGAKLQSGASFGSKWRELYDIMNGNESSLSDKSKEILKDLYLSSSLEGRGALITQIKYMACKNQSLKDQAVDEIFQSELLHQNGDLYNSLCCIRDICLDLKIYDWFVKTLERGFVHKIEMVVLRPFQHVMVVTKQLLPEETIIWDLPALFAATTKVFMFYFDVMKDMSAIYILYHISEEIIRHNFELVGGIDLDILMYYLIFVLISSQLAKFIYGISSFSKKIIRNMNDQEEDGKESKKRILELLFPIHYSVYGQAIYRQREVKIENDLVQLSKQIVNANSNEASLASQETFSERLKQLVETRNKLKTVRMVFNRHQLLETVAERIPQVSIQLSLFLASKEHKFLRALFSSLLQSIFGLSSVGNVAFGIAFVTSLMGIVSSIRNFKNEKRFPQRTSLTGSVIQILGICALLFAKIFMVSATLIHAPYILPLTTIMEFVVIVLYNRFWFGLWEFFSFNNLTSLTTTAFMKGPNSDAGFKETQQDGDNGRKKGCLGSVKAILELGSNTLHSVILGFLVASCVYVPIGLVLKLELFKLFGQTMGFMIEAAIWFAISIPIYILLAFLYYFHGHNWKLEIRSNPANMDILKKIFCHHCYGIYQVNPPN